MNTKNFESAFMDAVVVVATSNTVNYLNNRLMAHPIVQYIVDAFPRESIEEKLESELDSYDRSLRATTVVLTLVCALLRTSKKGGFPAELVKTLDQKKVSWGTDLVRFHADKHAPTSSAQTWPAQATVHGMSARHSSGVATWQNLMAA